MPCQPPKKSVAISALATLCVACSSDGAPNGGSGDATSTSVAGSSDSDVSSDDSAPDSGPEDTGVTVALVPPGGRATIPFDPFVAAGAEGVVVRAGRPVVVDRLVSEIDGRRLALGAGLPGLAGAEPLAAVSGD